MVLVHADLDLVHRELDHEALPAGVADDEVAALFDKYNLVTLAVLDEHERLAGIITADDVITMLRHRR